MKNVHNLSKLALERGGSITPLKFNSKEEAIDYADLHSLKYRILNNNTKTIKPKSYADNFSFKRKGLWSH